jgi:Transposase DDE domain group 1
MTTQSSTDSFLFQTDSPRDVCVSFSGGHVTSDGGALLLAEAERATGILRQLAACFTDHRDPDLIEHTAYQLLAQRVYGLCLGYEDLLDHDSLRLDPLLATLVGKDDPLGSHRGRARDQGKGLAGKSTLNRLELTPPDATAAARYKKVVADPSAIEELFVDVFVQAHPTPPEQVVLDLDATDDPLHGHQEGRFFHGYYREYCYLPLYIFCGEHLLVAQLRTAEHGAADGALEQLQRVVARIRSVWPHVRILVRGDADFCKDEIMSWCEGNGVDYLFGLAQNARLLAAIGPEMERACIRYLGCGVPCRVWADFRYRTLKSWSRERRVVGKAEYLPQGPNPRFVVTSLAEAERPPQGVYEVDYCSRGDTENRIKEQKRDLAAGRTSTSQLRSNQLRLWFSAVAYLLVSALRRLGLAGTALAAGQCGTIRQQLLKIGGLVRVTARRVWVSLSSAWPLQGLFARVYRTLRGLPTAAVPSGVAVPLRC